MNIKNGEVQRLAKELAAATGETMTSVIQHALEEKLERRRRDREVVEKKRRIQELLDSDPGASGFATAAAARRHQRPFRPLRRMGTAQMIVDASAVLAMLLKEPEEHSFADFIGDCTGDIAISPANYLEIALRVDRGKTPELSEALDPLPLRLGVRIVPVSVEQARLAREAYQQYGKGKHAAKLNLGDCFAYALAKARGEPLLFKGDGFRQTDVEAAI